MKSINLKSLIEIYENNFSLNNNINKLKLGNQELRVVDLKALKNLINEIEAKKNQIPIYSYNDFWVSYSIPQIGKELDLLRFTDDDILNIELKSEYTSKVQEQLRQNYYYLKFLNKKILLYTYCAKENILYKLDNNTLVEANIIELIELIQKQANKKILIDNPDIWFKPSNYLISPFSKTKEFIDEEYFLTKEQEEMEQKIEKNIKNGHKYFLITGEAGSGKTLLTYHIAKKYVSLGHNTAIIHVGNLNNGHLSLIQEYNWNINSIKNYKNIFEQNPPEILIIDEVQRMNNKKQFDEIVSNIAKNHSVLILSGDKKQTLSNNEGWAIDASNVKRFELTGKIRTNKELSNFIKVLLDVKRKHHIKVSNKNINITFFNTVREAKEYIETKTNYTYISYTPNTGLYSPLCEAHRYDFSHTGSSHQVVGQEFENVITILDKHFYYDEEQVLKSYKIQYNPYSPLKMFFQQITRAINNLEIVIIENINLYNKIMSIFE